MKLVSYVIWIISLLCPRQWRTRFFIHARCLVQWFLVGRYEW